MSSEDGVSLRPRQGSHADKTEACRELEAAYDAAVTSNSGWPDSRPAGIDDDEPF
jgi:hypothetical protein